MRSLRYIILGALIIAGSACGGNPAPNMSPEAKAAFYGEKFLSLVEQAQAQTIALVGQAGITKADVTPAVEVFVQIGRGGQDFAAALKVIDESNVTASQQAAAVRVRAAVTAFQDLLGQVTVRVSSEATRTRIAQVVAALKLGAALFDVVQRITPFLSETPTVDSSWHMSWMTASGPTRSETSHPMAQWQGWQGSGFELGLIAALLVFRFF